MVGIMTSKGKKAAPVGAGVKSKKAPGFGKVGGGAPTGGGAAAPLATFEDEDMYQEPIKKVTSFSRLSMCDSCDFESWLRMSVRLACPRRLRLCKERGAENVVDCVRLDM